MKWFFPVAMLTAATLNAAPVAAQTSAPAATTASAPIVNLWYAGLITGVSAVQKSGGTIGGEAGVRARHNLDILLEGGRFSDVVTSRESQAAAPITAFLQSTQGKAAASSMKVPALYTAIGARWVFENIDVGKRLKLPVPMRPYAQFVVGGARVERKPTFTLGGTDVTSSLSQYGVTLGRDLTGRDSHAAVGGGFGLLMPIQKWYFDIGYRVTSIQTTGQATNVNRFHIGFGARF